MVSANTNVSELPTKKLEEFGFRSGNENATEKPARADGRDCSNFA